MSGRLRVNLALVCLAAAAALALPALADAQEPASEVPATEEPVIEQPATEQPTGEQPASEGPAASKGAARSAASEPLLRYAVKAPRRASVLQWIWVGGRLTDPGPRKRVTVRVRLHGRRHLVRKLDPNDVTGRFRTRFRVNACCLYSVFLQHANQTTKPDRFRVKVPQGVGSGRQAMLFHRLLRQQGYHVQGISKRSNWSTKLAILAFRKANGMSWNSRFSPRIYRLLLQRRGAFRPKHKQGRHVEVDLSRQVMALVAGGKARHTFHVSTGTSATPTVRGKFRFYLRQPGYNAVRMYYSVYFHGGYATHGYDPVPTYPASHGCVRNPIPYSYFIYNWVSLGMPIYVYG